MGDSVLPLIFIHSIRDPKLHRARPPPLFLSVRHPVRSLVRFPVSDTPAPTSVQVRGDLCLDHPSWRDLDFQHEAHPRLPTTTRP